MFRVAAKLIRLCRPKTSLLAQFSKNISKHLFEKARAEENVHFLKLQREQLKSLRLKILGQKNAVTSKINEVDKQIKSLEQTDTKRTGSKLH